MEFLARQTEAKKDDAPVSSPAVAKPEPLVDNAGELLHEPDCTYQMAPIGHVHFGCCKVEAKPATFSGSGGDSKPADPAAGAAPAGDAGAGAGSSGASSSGGGDTGGSGSTGGSSSSGGGGDNAAAGKTGDDAKQQSTDDKPAKVTSIKFTTSVGAAIAIDGSTYREMFKAVTARADLTKEGGKITPGAPVVNCIYKEGTKEGDTVKKIDTCTVTVDIAISLPSWSSKSVAANGPDKGKWEAWYNSVKAHEDRHVAAMKTITGANIKPTGDKESDVNTAIEAAFTANGPAQEAVDGTPPAPLAAPGGMEKVGANEGGAGDSKQASAGAENKPAAGGDTAPAPAAPPKAPGGDAPTATA